MMLKKSILDIIFRPNRYHEIIMLRNQINFMIEKFNELDILIRLSKYYDINMKIFQKDIFSLNEVCMYHEFGEKFVINRLEGDRNEIFNLLKDIKEIDISDVVINMRDEKINNILN